MRPVLARSSATARSGPAARILVAVRSSVAVAGLTLVLAACSAAPAANPGATASAAAGSPSPTPSASAVASPGALGSASPAAPTPAASTAATTGHIVDTASGFGLTLPKDWRALDLAGTPSAAEAASLAGILGTSTVNAQTYLQTVQAVLPSGVRLFALDTATFDPAVKFATSLNVLRLPVGSATLDQLEAANVAQLEALAVVKPIDHIRVTLPAGPAIRFTYGFRVPSSAIPGGIIQTSQYLLLAGGWQWVITLSSGGPPTAQEQADFLSIADSFGVLP